MMNYKLIRIAFAHSLYREMSADGARCANEQINLFKKIHSAAVPGCGVAVEAAFSILVPTSDKEAIALRSRYKKNKQTLSLYT